MGFRSSIVSDWFGWRRGTVWTCTAKKFSLGGPRARKFSWSRWWMWRWTRMFEVPSDQGMVWYLWGIWINKKLGNGLTCKGKEYLDESYKWNLIFTIKYEHEHYQPSISSSQTKEIKKITGLCAWQPGTFHPATSSISTWSGQQWLAWLWQSTWLTTVGVHVQRLGHSSHSGHQQWSNQRRLVICFISFRGRVGDSWSFGCFTQIFTLHNWLDSLFGAFFGSF